MKQEIFTLDIQDLTNGEYIDSIETETDYESFDDAHDNAVKYIRETPTENVLNIFILGGEYRLDSGDIIGEPESIYCISNKGVEETMSARKNENYVSLNVDEYITD